LIISTQLHPEQGTARSDPIWQSEFVKRFVGLSATAQRRVYFARQDTSGDRGGCVNRSVLTELADEFEFEKVHPELLSFDKQVELAASTIALFGERGSAMMWSFFMPTSSRTIVVNGKTGRQKDRHVTIQNPVLAARGSRYCEINAVRVGSHQHFEVDPRLLRTAMEQLP
jgi:capsular polysaccharide biosynthesis protein